MQQGMMRSGADFPISRRRVGRLGGLRACEGLSQAVYRLAEPGDLLRQPFGISLLGFEQVPDRPQLILHDLQIVDRFLLGGLQSPRLLNQLLGDLRCPRLLQLAREGDPVQFGRDARIGAPQRDNGHSDDNDKEGRRGECDRLPSRARDHVGSYVSCELPHQTANPRTKADVSKRLPQAGAAGERQG